MSLYTGNLGMLVFPTNKINNVYFTLTYIITFDFDNGYEKWAK